MPTSDFSPARVQEMYTYLQEYVSCHSREFLDLGKDPEDFQQEVILNLMVRKGYDNYNPDKITKGSFRLFIYRVAKNHLIDIKRKKYGTKSRRGVKVISMDARLTEDGFTLADVTPAQQDYTSSLFEMEDQIPDQQISPNYNMTWRQLFRWSIETTVEKIAENIGISASRVSQLQKQLGSRYLSI